MKLNLYKAIKKSISGNLIFYAVQFFFLAFYTRIFSPEEFGLIASIQVFVVFFQMLSEVGIGPAVINEKTFTSKQRDGIFTVTIFLGFFFAALFYGFSYLLNYFYGGEYQDLALIVSFGVFFSSLNIMPMAALNKDGKFLHISMTNIFSEVLSFFCVYFLYSYGFQELALGARFLCISFFRLIFNWIISFYTTLGRAFLGRELYHINKILNFSLYQFGFNFINYFSRNLDNILIGKFFGMISLGIYDKAYQLMRYPLIVTTFSLTPAIQPTLTRFRNDINLIVSEHNLLARRLIVISSLISIFIFLNAEDIVVFLFGADWLRVVPFIKVFCFMIPIQAVLSTIGSFFQVINRADLLFYSGMISAFLNVSSMFLGIAFGEPIYLARCLLVSFLISFIQNYYILFRFGFACDLRGFYIHLFRGLYFIVPIIFSYFLLFYFFLSELSFLPIINIFINACMAFLTLLVFYKKVKVSLLLKS